MKEKLKNQTGITLVALVITIIILLILATVTIRIVLSEGIIKRAENAVDSYNTAQTEETTKLNTLEAKMSKYGPKTVNPNWWIPTAEEETILKAHQVWFMYGVAASETQGIIGYIPDEEGNIIAPIILKDSAEDGIICIYATEKWIETLEKDDPSNIGEGVKANMWVTTTDGSGFSKNTQVYKGSCPISLKNFEESEIYCSRLLEAFIDSF